MAPLTTDASKVDSPQKDTTAKDSTARTTVASLESVLEHLIDSVGSSLVHLEGDLNQSLISKLHSQDELPDRKLVKLAAEAVDVVHKVQVQLDPPTLILADHFMGYVRSKCLSAAVERGVADVLASGPMTLEQLAAATSSRSDRLGQIMPMLYNSGIFSFDPATGMLDNNHVSSLLLSDHWTQWRNWVELYCNQFYDIARGIPTSTQKDATRWSAQINYDTDLNMFSYFQEQGWLPILHRTLSGTATAQMRGMVEDYPWHEVADEVVIDIGGGGGGFIAGLLRKYKTMHGGIYDLSGVIEHTRPFFNSDGQYSDVGDRVAPEHLIAGDFFKGVPPSSVYTIKWCLHDWKDAEALAILKNIRKALIAGPKSRLVVLEVVLSDSHSGRVSRYADINMMMTADGQERTEEQWGSLAALSGWRMAGIYDLRGAWAKAIDFRPVESAAE